MEAPSTPPPVVEPVPADGNGGAAVAAEPAVVEIAVGTRPDCLPPDVLALLGRINQTKPLWVELGLQIADDALNEPELKWLVVIHLVFVISGVLMAAMDWITARAKARKY